MLVSWLEIERAQSSLSFLRNVQVVIFQIRDFSGQCLRNLRFFSFASDTQRSSDAGEPCSGYSRNRVAAKARWMRDGVMDRPDGRPSLAIGRGLPACHRPMAGRLRRMDGGRTHRVHCCVCTRPSSERSASARDSFRVGSGPYSGNVRPATVGNNCPARRQDFGSQTRAAGGIGRSGSRFGSSENLCESLCAGASPAFRSKFGGKRFHGGFSSPFNQSCAMAGGTSSSEMERRPPFGNTWRISTSS